MEATFVNRGAQIRGLFAGLRYIVVDEMHSFIAEPRGAQLQSLMNRLERAVGRRAARVGLSATLGDMAQAQAFLRPDAPERVVVVESTVDGRELMMQLRGYIASPPPGEARPVEQSGRGPAAEDDTAVGCAEIAGHIFENLRGQDNLVFANRRSDVEAYADLLARRSDQRRVPNEFLPHHGNLSKGMREAAEAQLKDRTRPATAVCTSTLEMGIDIGSVASIAQIGVPPSVATLRQRLGRSGRKDDDPAVLRMYISEAHVDERSSPIDELRCSTVQTTAMVRLLLDRWVESPDDPGFNYSTLIQQAMSKIAEQGGATAADLHSTLCGPGPFHLVDERRFVLLLKAMAARDLVIQASDGLLLHGTAGERHVNHYSFYTAFRTPEEWRLEAYGKPLGTVPIAQPLYEGVLLIFAGKRWKATGIDTTARVVQLERSAGGRPPAFSGAGPRPVSDRVRAEMLAVYESDDTPVWLDGRAQRLLAEGRAAFARLGLSDTTVIGNDSDVLLLPWTGDRALYTAAVALQGEDVDASVEGPAIRVRGCDVAALDAAVGGLLARGVPTADDLAGLIANVEIDKWDWVLDDTLARESAAARLLDTPGAWAMLADTTPSIAAAAAGNAASTTPARHAGPTQHAADGEQPA